MCRKRDKKKKKTIKTDHQILEVIKSSFLKQIKNNIIPKDKILKGGNGNNKGNNMENTQTNDKKNMKEFYLWFD